MLLRPYQTDCIDRLRDGYRQGFRRQLLVSPTGSGKTCVFSFVAKSSAEKGQRTLILTHRSEILAQIVRMLSTVGVEHAVLKAGMRTPKTIPTVVASVNTLVRRLGKFPPPDLIIVDEGHHAAAGTWVKVFAQWPEARVLGVTATPERLDGKGLAGYYDNMVRGPEVQWLIDNGFLARPRYFSPEHLVDTSHLRKVAGDFSKTDSAALVDKPTITGDAVAQYRRHANGKRAVAFCVSVAHAVHVSEQFRNSGIPSLPIDGTMTDEQRSTLIRNLASGQVLVLTSCDLISEGFDLPAVDAAILLRPTASMAMHLQQVGRCLRPCDGKANALILDHVGNCLRHGLAEEYREWSLEGGTAKKRKEEVVATRRCETCYAIFAGKDCPQCGKEYEAKVREIAQREGELREMSAEELAARRLRLTEERDCQTLDDFKALAKRRGYSDKWPLVKWSLSWQKRAFLRKRERSFRQPTML